MLENLPEIAVGVGLILFCVFAWLYQWRTAPDEKREQMVEATIARLVDAAEQIYKAPGSGMTKFGYVMGKLVKRYRDMDWSELEERVEAAVHRQNASRAARQAVTSPRQNGTHEAN